MLVADYVAKYLAKREIDCVFGYPGGMVTYLMDSFVNTDGIEPLLLYHEQAAAFAACGYAQATGKVGVAYATSGPGATNLVTGIGHAYYESVPTLFITGQVNTNEAKGNLSVRQKGFQETEIVKIVDSITKYAVYVENANKIKYYLDKAFFEATSGRPGPTLLDIPIDIQRTEIVEAELEGYIPQIEYLKTEYDEAVEIILEALNGSKQPLLILGNGINIADCRAEIRELLSKVNIPAVTSMVSVDILHSDSKNNYGFIGAYGLRYSNFILSQCDLIISLGSRLDVRQTGVNKLSFAPNAKLVRVDIDRYELENKIKEDEIDICLDLKYLLKYINAKISNFSTSYSTWLNKCDYYKLELLGIDDLSPNKTINRISKLIPDDVIITTDVGQNQVWVSQSFGIKPSQRILFSGGHGAMGFSLPAAIGAYYGLKKNVYCICGDGGFQMNVQELQFLARERIPVGVILLNNHSLGMIRHFQEMYFDARYTQTVETSGYSVPNFTKLAEAYDIESWLIASEEDFSKIDVLLSNDQPFLLEVLIDRLSYVYPKLVFNKPLYDQDPPLNQDIIQRLLSYKGI